MPYNKKLEKFRHKNKGIKENNTQLMSELIPVIHI